MRQEEDADAREHIPKWNTANGVNAVLSLGPINASGDVFVYVVAVGVHEGDGEVAGVVAV